MTSDLDPLVHDLVDWIGRGPRAYADVLEAWRTSCPRLTVWEEAVERGLVSRESAAGAPALVHITPEGEAFLARYRRAPA